MRVCPGVIAALGVASAQAAPWINNPPEGFRAGAVPIEKRGVYEVVHSKREEAVLLRLSDRAFLQLSTQQGVHFTGEYMTCENGTTPYLIRAPFSYGGEFAVFSKGNEVLVEHNSMGHSSPINHSALVVCLRSEPLEIYSQVNVTE